VSVLQRFLAYVDDFEKTYRDDDWTRLEKYFAPDAVYEVKNTPFACSLCGRAAILRGLKRSLDGFDRRCAERRIEVPEPPQVEGDRIEVGWRATYVKEGAPPVTLRAHTVVELADDRIVRMADVYDEGNGDATAAWIREHGAGLDPSYA
jgi:hypothetical protein